MTYDSVPVVALSQAARHLRTLAGWTDTAITAGTDPADVLDELCQYMTEISYALDDVTTAATP